MWKWLSKKLDIHYLYVKTHEELMTAARSSRKNTESHIKEQFIFSCTKINYWLGNWLCSCGFQTTASIFMTLQQGCEYVLANLLNKEHRDHTFKWHYGSSNMLKRTLYATKYEQVDKLPHPSTELIE